MNGMGQVRRVRGVSLIEALVALAVMAVGLLGVVGMQASLRFNADVSRQRAEAVRLAQEKMEELRAFGVLSGSPAGEHDYDKIVASVEAPVATASGASAGANAVFNRTVIVPATAASAPRLKMVQVRVDWLDRRTAAGGMPESVTLTSSVAQVAPVLSASLGLPGDRAAPQQPQGRHHAIPHGAVSLPNGTSSFAPPGAPSGVFWIFSNSSGLITSQCTAVGTCTAVAGTLLSGYTRFVTITAVRPSAADAEQPAGSAASFGTVSVQVTLTNPVSPAVAPICYAEAVPALAPATFSVARQYYCFVPTDTTLTPNSWTGRSDLTGLSPIAGSMGSALTTEYKVCRYTPNAATGGNASHPATYNAVTQSLANQNFLVIPAGNGTLVYLCPGTAGPLIDSTTAPHQPAS